MLNALKWAAAGTGFTFLLTCLGASIVFFFRGEMKGGIQKAFLGFAAGVMVAASVWSLLIPAMDQAGWLPATGGMILGIAFLMLLDSIIPHLHPDSEKPEGPNSSLGKPSLLMLAVTLHNIPEGMAVGLAFAVSAQTGDLSAATALAIGIGIQNFPEGAAISLPLKQTGLSSSKAFLRGAFSGVVEPIFGILVVLIASVAQPLMPWMLSFAAGAMLYVVVEELIPEAHLGEHSNVGTLGFLFGFIVMMILDVALG